ncbi:MAG: hypothetical protein ACYS8I_11195 [Planctomycetota bacterium]|jgi:hypothetical protein
MMKMPAPTSATLILCLILFLGGPDGHSAITSSPDSFARIVFEGHITCFERGLQTSEGNAVFAETSAVVYTGRQLIFANDKPIPGSERSPVFAVACSPVGPRVSGANVEYFPGSINKARKYEGLTITLDGKYILATTAFDRIKRESSEWDNYNILVAWPVGKPETSRILTLPPQGNARSSVSLRKRFSRALRTKTFPDGVPYLKIEGLAAIPGNTLLFGVRGVGKSYKDFDNVVKIIAVTYTIREGRFMLEDEFKLLYDYDPAQISGIAPNVGLSGLEYDGYRNRLYLLGSFENGESDEGLGGYLWVLPIAQLSQGRPPTLVRDKAGKPLLFAHKPEGVAVLGKNRVFVIHDDDRVLGRENVERPETQFSRKAHEAAYAIVEFKR